MTAERTRKPFLCVLRIHHWAWVGRPGARESYRRCRRCKKARLRDMVVGMGAFGTPGDTSGAGYGGEVGGGWGDFGGGDFGGGGGGDGD